MGKHPAADFWVFTLELNSSHFSIVYSTETWITCWSIFSGILLLSWAFPAVIQVDWLEPQRKIGIDVGSVFLASHPHTSLFQQKGGGGSWLGGLFSKFGRSSNNEMKLPDDKDPAVSHDCPFSFCLCFKGKLQLVYEIFGFLCVLFSSSFFFFFFFMCFVFFFFLFFFLLYLRGNLHLVHETLDKLLAGTKL